MLFQSSSGSASSASFSFSLPLLSAAAAAALGLGGAGTGLKRRRSTRIMPCFASKLRAPANPTPTTHQLSHNTTNQQKKERREKMEHSHFLAKRTSKSNSSANVCKYCVRNTTKSSTNLQRV